MTLWRLELGRTSCCSCNSYCLFHHENSDITACLHLRQLILSELPGNMTRFYRTSSWCCHRKLPGLETEESFVCLADLQPAVFVLLTVLIVF